MEMAIAPNPPQVDIESALAVLDSALVVATIEIGLAIKLLERLVSFIYAPSLP